MVFWIAILAGGLFVWLAVRMGFYETWILLFNILISMYVAIFLAPTVVAFAPATGGGASYGTALSMIVLAGSCFAILHGMSYVFLTAQFSIAFPRVFDILLAGLLGFLAGFLVFSFVALVITTTPLAEHKMVSTVGFNRESQTANITCVGWCCDLVHAVAAPEVGDHATRKAVDRLFAHGRNSEPEATPGESDPNEASAVRRP